MNTLLKQAKSWTRQGAPLLLAGFLLTGCEVSRQDVADARKDVIEEQRETEQAKADAAENISEKQRELDDARHSTLRTPYNDGNLTDETAAERKELEDTRQRENEEVREEEQETMEAKKQADRLARELAAKKSREAYVATVNTEIEAVEQRLEDMRTRLDGMEEGAERQQLETDIEVLDVKRENQADALSEIENAELLEWESKKTMVEQARERIKSNS